MVLDSSEVPKTILLPLNQLLVLFYAGLAIQAVHDGSIPIRHGCQLVECLPTAFDIRFVVQVFVLDIELTQAARA